MSARTRLLGIDYGTKRIGLAVSDPDRKIASPLATYEPSGKEADARFFQNLIATEEIGQLVVGLPIHLSGDESPKSAEARSFGKWLHEVTGLPVVFADERFSSVEAESALWNAGLTHKQRKARRDRLAAQIMLQGYIDVEHPMLPESRSEPIYGEDGVDLTLIRWMLSLTPDERLDVLQQYVNATLSLRDANPDL